MKPKYFLDAKEVAHACCYVTAVCYIEDGGEVTRLCECYSVEDAEKICTALNTAKENLALAMFKVIADDNGNLHGLPIDFAGPEPEAEPESLLPEPLDNSVKLNMQQAEELLLDSVKSDVLTFMTNWRAYHEAEQEAIDDERGLVRTRSYPAELTADGWYEQFYAWMGV